MSTASDSNQPMKLRKTVEQAAGLFEEKFKADASYRIEEFIRSEFDLENLEGVPNGDEEVMKELINLEMDLRFSKHQSFDRFEYDRRFPDYADAIIAAFEGLRRRHNDDLLSKNDVIALTVDFESHQDRIASSDGALPLPTSIGRFNEISKIGEGGFGIVCRAMDTERNEWVALKFPRRRISDNLLADVQKEVEHVIPLDHFGIVKTHSMETIEPYVFVVQQFVDGSDLKSSLGKTRSQKEIAELVAKIAVALEYAHLMKLVHRDIKPANILLDKNDNPFVADFGLAIHERDQFNTPKKQQCGTPVYMSPQLVEGLVRNLDGRTDIWSLGVIFYEMLTGQRPFRGHTENDIFEQIESADPKPPRMIKGDIDPELERICLKCLSYFARDRYSTGGDLALDLRTWIGEKNAPLEQPVDADFIPKGLRSYGPEDSDFFLELLPGPKDRDGVPGSIRFWKARINEPVSEENRVPVGAIYGPSGSGKSSFIKAGLIPQLNSDVTTIYVESTQSDTEVRLIKALRKEFPAIPNDLSLPQMFAGIVRRSWEVKTKVLLVFDQFEQRLSEGDDYAQSQIAKALRHCDGEFLQCILLVRDDFCLGLTRFLAALEDALRVGQNAQVIEPFDKDHARGVLIKLGWVYGKLFAESENLTAEQEKFLGQSLAQLVDKGCVICVRLTLFAEMFKNRPWTVNELQAVGGVQGVGERFLESTFGEEATNRGYQIHRDCVQRVLEALLPESGSLIRGVMKSRQELLESTRSVGNQRHFESAINILEKELFLITKTDPDISGGDLGNSNQVYYQLTHDYLVPSIRNWLNSELKKTHAGRVLTRIREMARDWTNNREKGSIPTLAEFAPMVPFLPFLRLNEIQKQFLKRTLITNGIRLAGFGSLLFAVILAVIVYRTRQREQLTKTHVDLFANCRPDAVPVSIELLKQNKTAAVRILKGLKDKTRSGSSALIHRINLGLCLLDPSVNEPLIEVLKSVGQFDSGECKNLLRALALSNGNTWDLIANEFDKVLNPLEKARFAILGLFFRPGKYQNLGLGFAISPDFRTEVLLKLDDWHGEESQYRNTLEALTDDGALAGFLIAIGRRSKSDFSPSVRHELIESAKQIFRSDERSSVHSASKWLLTQWEVDIPEVQGNRFGEWYLNSAKMTMVKIEAGQVTVAKGSKNPTIGETNVLVPKPFFIGDKEVRIKEFVAFQKAIGYEVRFPKEFDLDNSVTDHEMPVSSITLDDIVEFCNWMSSLEDLDPFYVSTNKKLTSVDPEFDRSFPGKVWRTDSASKGYRLPTYAEWELAASGNTTSEYYFGSARLTEHLSHFAWHSGNSFVAGELAKHRCGTKIPNPFGLFDIAGNVQEVCWDSPFEKLPLAESKTRFVRGGGFESSPPDCMTGRFEFRSVTNPNATVGFRIAKNAN